MRKTKLFKRSAAVVISASMVLTSVNVIPELKEEAKAANAVTPVFSMDFSGTMGTDGNYTENGNTFKSKNAEIVDGKLHIKQGGPAVDGASVGYLESGTIFANNDFSNGVTVQFEWKSEKQASDWDYIFSLGTTDPAWNYVDATSGFIMRMGDAYQANFPNGSWDTKNSVIYKNAAGSENPFDYFNSDAHVGETHTMSYVYSKTGTSIYVDGVLSNSWTTVSSTVDNIYTKLNKGYFVLGANVAKANESCNGTYDDVKIYDKALNAAEIYKVATGKDRVADATELETSITEAAKYTRSELYKEDGYKTLTEKLAVANTVDGNPMALAEEILKAKTELDAAIASVERKAEDITSDVLIDSDMTNKTSYVDKAAKTITSNGYTIKAVGDSEIQDGYITGAKELSDKSGKDGAVLDGSVLRNTTAEKGFTINTKLSLDTVDIADWSDVIGFYDDDFESTDATTGETKKETVYKLRGTLGLAMMSPTAIFEWPGATANSGKVKDADGNDKTISGVGGVLYNGMAWDSYKTLAADNKTIDYTVTMDKNAYSIYLNGKLAVTYANNDDNWLDVDSVLKYTDSITFMQTKDATADRRDLLGKLYGVQVYGRALNAAEVDTLVTSGTTASPKGITFKNQAADATISVKDANGTEVATAVCGTDGAAVVHGLTTGQTYTFTIKNGETWTREGSITVDTDKVIDGWAATGVKFKEETLELKNSKIKATGEVKNDVKNLPALVLDPENTSEKIEDCKISYASDKEEVAKVSEDGKVTAVADGEANITATVVTPSGKTLTAVCKVKVSTTEVTDVATAVKLDQETASIEIGKTLQLKAEVTPGTALQHGTWKSSNEAVAKVNEAGLVTAVAAGEAEITFTTADGTNLSAKCKVTVTAKAEPTVAPSATPAPGTSAEPTVKPSAAPTAKPTVAPTKKPSNTKKPAKKLKSATITVKNGKKKVSSVTVKTKKSVKLAVSVNSKAKLSVAKLSKKNAKIAKVTFKKNKLTIKGLKKGKVSIKITSKKTSKYKAATKTIKVTVKK